MAELPLRTIKTARRNSTLKRSDVTKAIKAVMARRGEVPTPQKPTRKKAAASQK
jgi:hypothetical protein